MKVYDLCLPKSLAELLMSCESSCVAECCGLEAFEFTRERFDAWFGEHPGERELVREQIRALVADLRSRSEEEVSSTELNDGWPTTRAVEFFSGLERMMVGAS